MYSFHKRRQKHHILSSLKNIEEEEGSGEAEAKEGKEGKRGEERDQVVSPLWVTGAVPPGVPDPANAPNHTADSSRYLSGGERERETVRVPSVVVRAETRLQET